jgi:hypothetical protein
MVIAVKQELRALFIHCTAIFRSAVIREHSVHSCCVMFCGGEVNTIFWAPEPIFWPVASHNPRRDRIDRTYHDNWDRLGRLLGGADTCLGSDDKGPPPSVARVRPQGLGYDRPFPQCSDTQPGCFSPRYNRNLAALAGIPRHWAQDWRGRHSLTQILSGGFSSSAALRLDRMRREPNRPAKRQ